MKEVSEKHGVSVAELLSDRRERRIAWPRQELMFRLRNETNMSLPAIGQRLGDRDHTTILYGVNAHARRMAEGQAAE